jgi:hypothetical protein
MLTKKKLRNSIDVNVDYFEDEIRKLKTIIGDVPAIVRPYSIFSNLLWVTSFLPGGESVKEDKYPKQKTVLAQNFMDIKEKLDKQGDQIDELLKYKKQSEMELDDLKLRICVLEQKVNDQDVETIRVYKK